MTRIKISVFIVFLLVMTSIFSGMWINKRCVSVMELSQLAGELFSSNQKEQAIEITEQLENEWKDFRSYASVWILNSRLSEIDRICARIKYLAENDSDELLSELAELENMLDFLRNGEIPKINSVF